MCGIDIISTLFLTILFDSHFHLQMELYNDMVEKEGTEGEEEAKKAYKEARKDSDQAAELALTDKASSALIDRVTNLERILSLVSLLFFLLIIFFLFLQISG